MKLKFCRFPKFQQTTKLSYFPILLISWTLIYNLALHRYFRQTVQLLIDPKELLFAVNAYNYNSYPETAGNYSRLIRHQGTPAYGWMITRAVAQEIEEIDFWPLEKDVCGVIFNKKIYFIIYLNYKWYVIRYTYDELSSYNSNPINMKKNWIAQFRVTM